MKNLIVLILILTLSSNCGNSKKATMGSDLSDASPFDEADMKALDELTQATEENPEAPVEQQGDVASLLDQVIEPFATDAFKDSQISQLLKSWSNKLEKQEGTIKMLNFLLLILHLAKGSKEKCYQEAIAGGKKGIMKRLKLCAQDDFSKTLMNPAVIHQLIGLTNKTPAEPAATQRLMDPLKDGLSLSTPPPGY